jgi:LmbE family N-acetylglucosaminyl deacetylase
MAHSCTPQIGGCKTGGLLKILPAKEKHMNPYRQYVSGFTRLSEEGRGLPLGGMMFPVRPALPPTAPAVLIFSPHPDDECIIGALALRWLREAGKRVINIGVTLGSNRERQQPRLEELQNACQWLGFGLETATPRGLERINAKTRTTDPAHWGTAVKTIAEVLRKHKPQTIFFPHALDWNSTHIGVHLLVMDALKTLPSDFQTGLIETEFWGQMADPNLMVESGVEDVADLLAALSFHVGEVRRNPYHLRLPAWLMDNVRRGAELVGGQGGGAPDFQFATLYKASRWLNGKTEQLYMGGKQIGQKDDSSGFLP